MLKRDWFGNLTIALVALAALAIGSIVCAIAVEQYIKRHELNVGYQQHAESERRRANEVIAETCFQSDFSQFRKCVSNQLETYYEERADSQDLKAQHDMAYWAGAIFFLGVFQAMIALAGIYYVAGNLIQTAESVQLTNKALTLENRPWLSVSMVPTSGISWHEGSGRLSFAIIIKNHGRGPALDVKCNSVVDVAYGEYIGSDREYEIVREAVAMDTDGLFGLAIFPGDEFVERIGFQILGAEIDKSFSRFEQIGREIEAWSPKAIAAIAYKPPFGGKVFVTYATYDISRVDPLIPNHSFSITRNDGDVPLENIQLTCISMRTLEFEVQEQSI